MLLPRLQPSSTSLRPLTRHLPLLRSFSSTLGRMKIVGKSDYPPTRRDESKILTFQSAKRGMVEIPDPYQWLETPPSESAETAEWVSIQATFARSKLDAVPSRDAFRSILSSNWDYAKLSAPARRGEGADEWYYFHWNSGLQNQYELRRIKVDDYAEAMKSEGDRTDATPSAPGELFFDPNKLSTDGTISLSSSSFSESGRLWAYGVSVSGSDWFTIKVRRTEGAFESQDDALSLEDEVRFAKFTGISWTHDEKGFFYQRFPEVSSSDLGTSTISDRDAAIYYHVLGTPQSSDVLVHSDPANPEWMFGVGVTTDGEWLIRTTSKDTAPSSLMSVARLDTAKAYGELEWKEVVTEWGASHSYMANDGSTFWFQTNKDATNDKVVRVDVSANPIVFEDVIAEDPLAVLEQAKVVKGDYLLLLYSKDVNNQLYLHRLSDGKRIRQFLPNFVGSIGGISGRRRYDEFFTSVGSYTDAGSIFQFDLSDERAIEKDDLKLVRSTKTSLQPSDFISEQIFYHSKDGTRIPMTVTRSKDVKLDGTAPCLLYGYGGFSISLGARFSPSWMTWVKSFGGVLAVPALRGGAEYGESWHEAGILDKKQNTFDDFIAAAQHLVEKKYTAPGRIITNGGSNGGLLVAAVANQAPEGLIGAHVADVGVLDLLNFHRHTVGGFWRSDYGDPDKPSDFDFIHPISPLHNINPQIRNLLLTTADHDDRVVPLHSFKHVAEAQHRGVENALIRIELKAGHGAGKPTSKVIDEQVDKLCWASHMVGATFRE